MCVSDHADITDRRPGRARLPVICGCQFLARAGLARGVARQSERHGSLLLYKSDAVHEQPGWNAAVSYTILK